MDIYEEIVHLRHEGRRAALATIINVRGSIPSFKSAKMLVREDGTTLGTIGGGCVEAGVIQIGREVIAEQRPRTLTFNLNQNPAYDTGLVCGGTLEVFVEPILPPSTIYLFGAGHVALNIYKVAHIAGFDIVMVDDRAAYATRERFPEAVAVYADEFERVTAQLHPHEGSFIVIATRGHREDMRLLRWAVGTPAKYIGMIGSKRKVITIYRELEKEGIAPEASNACTHPWGWTSVPSVRRKSPWLLSPRLSPFAESPRLRCHTCDTCRCWRRSRTTGTLSSLQQ